MIKYFLLALTTLTLTACFGFFDKDNAKQPTPLTTFQAEVKPRQIWSRNIGSGAKGEFLKLSPTLHSNYIYASSVNGVISATDKTNGRSVWQTNTNISVSSGPGVGSGIVVVGSSQGDIIALDEQSGKQRWKTSIPGEVIAKPAISNNLVIIKAIDGYLRALSTNDGHEVWAYQQTEPSLILRGASSPLISGNALFAGFANGILTKLSLNGGMVDWSQPIATPTGSFAIQRMVDINADPVIYQHRVLAATYQGNIASLDWNSGNVLWSHDISSYTGMAVDANAAFITDANGNVWAFGIDNGLVNWRQNHLEARGLSAPALMNQYVVVGDAEGYLHWLSKRDGHFAARESVGNSIYAAPIADNNVLYVLTSNGSLTAYTLN